ncbi:MAG: hypothetical protein KC776_37320, partial [Myxococcales bacterium]|nr:hypothetical protein [Myxococcales bacterium]
MPHGQEEERHCQEDRSEQQGQEVEHRFRSVNEAAALLSQPASAEALDGLQRLFIAARKRKTDVETWC